MPVVRATCTVLAIALLIPVTLNAQTAPPTPGMSNLRDYSGACAKAKDKPPNQKYCSASITAAIQAAITYMSSSSGGDYIIQIDPTVVDMSQEIPGDPMYPDSTPFFNLSPLKGVPNNLTFLGAGRAYTRIITRNGFETISGYGVSNVHFEGMTFNRSSMTTTQGVYNGTTTELPGAPGQSVPVTRVYVTIQPGFPLPILTSQNQSTSTAGDFGPISPHNSPIFRVYDNSNPLDPRILTDPDTVQVYFDFSKTTCDQTRTNSTGTPCVLTLYTDEKLPGVFTRLPLINNSNYLLGLKIETANNAVNIDGQSGTIVTPGSNGQPSTVTPINGTNVSFTDIDWTDEARMQLTHISNVKIVGNNILRRPAVQGSAFPGGYQSPLMSTDAGGPQIGQAQQPDFLTTGLLIKDFTAMATGDDSIAIFWQSDQNGAAPSQVTNTTISSSFARTINVYNSCTVHFNRNSGNQCDQAPELISPPAYQGCISDTTNTGRPYPTPTPCLIVNPNPL